MGMLCRWREGAATRRYQEHVSETVQPLILLGDFYGGWVTSELEGRMKGGPGTWGW